MSRERRRQPKASLARRVGVRKPRKTILIFCEGKNTEPQYFEALKREPDVRDVAAVDLRVDPDSAGGAPITLVRMAVDARRRALRESSEIDEFWCVFDVEWPTHHPSLHDALELAERNDIHVAVSNPCFELWLALHFKDVRAFHDNDQARRLRRGLDGQQGKSITGSQYMPLRKEAARRAAKLAGFHTENSATVPHDNPSSGMYRLIEATLPIGDSLL
ncbi:RloB family protein [Catenuloplanes japonicus]|uniref:RloB family protein n=1 Tax=Catenuloplanes japonicus TaxID=33876 RepID=UPI000526C015|nr:RloB family protein [Catenuloplanes japonicus]